MVRFDAVVIGGGFYGATIATSLANKHGFRKVALVEREPILLSRASYRNQARIHNGYHYPRSFTTAFRSRVNLPRFVREYPTAVYRDFTKLYAIARNNSKVTARQFRGFCGEIGVRLESAPQKLRSLFEPRLIEEVFLAEEYAFDAVELRRCSQEKLDSAGVDAILGTHVSAVRRVNNVFELTLLGLDEYTIRSDYVFNCTYSALHQFTPDSAENKTTLKHEISELALMDVPSELKHLGVTVMDGPFFSIMPFPARRLHTLSHVRYTPHRYWNDVSGTDPYAVLQNLNRSSRADRMLRDVCRYMPSLIAARYVDSLFEIKTVLGKNETDDGRPILFEKYDDIPQLYSILGGKLDNVYDCLEVIDIELATIARPKAQF